jgi:hypothetical protein
MDYLFQKNQNGGQVQNGGQGNFHYLISRERVKFISICLRIRAFFKKIKMVDKFKMAIFIFVTFYGSARCLTND